MIVIITVTVHVLCSCFGQVIATPGISLSIYYTEPECSSAPSINVSPSHKKGKHCDHSTIQGLNIYACMVLYILIFWQSIEITINLMGTAE